MNTKKLELNGNGLLAWNMKANLYRDQYDNGFTLYRGSDISIKTIDGELFIGTFRDIEDTDNGETKIVLDTAYGILKIDDCKIYSIEVL